MFKIRVWWLETSTTTHYYWRGTATTEVVFYDLK